MYWARQQRERLQGCTDATLICTAPSHAEADERDTLLSKPPYAVGKGNTTQAVTWRKEILVRIPVVDRRGVTLMPCTPAKARHLLKQGKEGWQTKELRDTYGLKKTKSKSNQSFESHAVDAWVLAASVSGAEKPTCTRLWHIVPARFHRRQLHHLQAAKGGIRQPYGGTRALGLKRGTIVTHKKHGLCTIGGFDRKKQTVSLHVYRTNKRLTQGAKVKDCRILTWVAWRSWLVAKEDPKKRGKEGHPTQAANKEHLFPSTA